MNIIKPIMYIFNRVKSLFPKVNSVFNLPELSTLTSLRSKGPILSFHEIKNLEKEYFATLSPSALEDANLDTVHYARKYGYLVETHEIVTDDGYVLVLHRLPCGRGDCIPVLLVHGLSTSSADWVIPGVGYSLAFDLVDAGYDVWLANTRGNTYSNRHIKLTTWDAEFWNYSFEDIGLHDIPAMIDYVLKTNGKSQLFYVGHSQGTSVIYTLLSEIPHYNAKIRAVVSLAPIAFMKHMVSPLLRIFNMDTLPVELLVDIFGNRNVTPGQKIVTQVSQFFEITGPGRILLTNLLFAVCGFSPDQMRNEILPAIMGHSSEGLSIKQLMHYGQLVHSGRFCKWNFGTFGNFRSYGKYRTPNIKLHRITAPQVLFYSHNDWLSHPTDVQKLFENLTGVVYKEMNLTGEGKFNHLDYMFARDAPLEVNIKVLEKLKDL